MPGQAVERKVWIEKQLVLLQGLHSAPKILHFPERLIVGGVSQ